MKLRLLGTNDGSDTHVVDLSTGRQMTGVRSVRWWIGKPLDARAIRPAPRVAVTEAGREFLREHSRSGRVRERPNGHNGELDLTFFHTGLRSSGSDDDCSRIWTPASFDEWTDQFLHGAHRLVSLGTPRGTDITERGLRISGVEFAEYECHAGGPGVVRYRVKRPDGSEEEREWTEDFTVDVRVGEA